VGPDKRPYLIHRHVLDRIPFFEACLRSSCKEAESGVVELPKASPEAFEMVLECALSGHLEIEKPDGYLTSIDASRAYTFTLVKTYSLATFLQMEHLANAVMDMVLELCRKWIAGSNMMNFIYAEDLENTKLMDLMYTNRVQHLRARGVDVPSNEAFLDHHVALESARVKRLVTALLHPHVEVVNAESACRWHTHDTTPKFAS
jgi:hypothetical protein